jgi:hypothetical protein
MEDFTNNALALVAALSPLILIAARYLLVLTGLAKTRAEADAIGNGVMRVVHSVELALHGQPGPKKKEAALARLMEEFGHNKEQLLSGEIESLLFHMGEGTAKLGKESS